MHTNTSLKKHLSNGADYRQHHKYIFHFSFLYTLLQQTTAQAVNEGKPMMITKDPEFYSNTSNCDLVVVNSGK